jgi:hypothetical protein
MEERELDVHPFRKNDEWHWEIIGPFPKPVGAGRLRDTCCDEALRLRKACQGFPDEGQAQRDGRRRRAEVIAEMRSKPD